MVIAHGNASDIGIAYAAIPRVTVSVDPVLVPTEQARELAAQWGVQAVAATTDAPYVTAVLPGARPGGPVAEWFRTARAVLWTR